MQILSGYSQQLLGIVGTTSRGRGGIFKKNFGFALLRRSPKSYVLLQTLFPLPSGRNLQSLLNIVNFRTGINNNVFHAVRHSVQKMSEKGQY